MNPIALVPLLSFVAYFALAALALRHPRGRERRAFTLYLGLAASWSFLSLFIRLENPFVQDHVLTISKVLMISFLCVTLAYYYFVRVFVHKRAGLGLYLGAAFILIIAVLAALGFIPEYASSSDGLLHVDFGFSLYLVVPFGMVMIGAAAYFLVQHRRETNSHLARVRITYLLTGLGVVTLATLTNISNTLAMYPIDHAGNLLNALIISYAILKYQLLDIRLVLRRGLTYSILSGSLTAIYLLFLHQLQDAFHGFTNYPGFIFAAGLAVLMAAIFAPLRGLLQDRVDRLFFRTTYDLRRMLSSFRTNLVHTLDLDRLANDTLRALLNGLDIDRACLLIPDPITGDFRGRFEAWKEETNRSMELSIQSDSPLVGLLKRETQVIRVELLETFPEAKGLHVKERDALRAQEICLLCSMVSQSGVVGILALGAKRRGGDYTTEEIEALLTMASWAALALYNAEVLDNLRHQQKRAEGLLAQVVQAQEQEREWIALELHDSVAQELVRVSYQAQVCTALLMGKDELIVQAELDGLVKSVEESIRELRRVLAGLRPPAIDELGLSHALKQATEDLGQIDVLSNFATRGSAVRLEPSMEISIYRIVQEALNNIRRHAQASKVDVQLKFQEDHLSIEITDDGKGFDVRQTIESSLSDNRMGLNGIKQRAEWLGGSVVFKSHKSRGTSVLVQLPLS